MESNAVHNPELQLTNNFVQYTGEHIFLTGKAGTGKTTFLHQLKKQSPKRMIVVAPTGVAAINAGGVTIHSFFQVSFGPAVPGFSANDREKIVRFSREKRNIIKSLDLLVIDEISMVRADLLDSIDVVLRKFRRNNAPFGGVQLLMIGDMQQLPPVVKEQEWNLLRKYYKTAFFFSSLALQKTKYITITLQHVYRQRDRHFIDMLNKIREKQIDQTLIDGLKERYKPGFDGDDENYIVLSTHNAKAKRINELELSKLKGKCITFKAEIGGNFPEYNYPTETDLELKVGAQVMFVKNDPEAEKKFYNGKIGVITSLEDNTVFVQCPDEDEEIVVSPLEWHNIKYSIDEDNKEIKETIEGAFSQIPLKLAWAITIHKSQGLTFDKVIIDAESAFAHGQVYVALSRCRSLEGLVLSSPFSASSLKHDGSIEGFNKLVGESQPDQQKLDASKADFQQQILLDLFTFKELFYAIGKLSNILFDHQKSLEPGVAKAVKSMKDPVRKDVVAVSETFQNQIRKYLGENADAEQNTDLQQRISKAADYFSEKLQKLIVDEMNSRSFETDNKETRKKIRNTIDRLEEETRFKLVCLQAVKNGFTVKDFLTERARASLEIPKTKTSVKKGKPLVSKEVSNPELYSLIKEWRNAKAVELQISHYMVVSLKTMRALSNQVPANLEELKKVHGLGRRKQDSFGEEILKLINDFKKDNEIVVADPPIVITTKKEPKKDTKQISFDLWLEHKDVKKIAEERDMTVSTIQGHLAHFVGMGKLPVTDFVDDKKLASILKIFEKDQDISVSEARSQSENAYSYKEIKFARQHLNWLATK